MPNWVIAYTEPRLAHIYNHHRHQMNKHHGVAISHVVRKLLAIKVAEIAPITSAAALSTLGLESTQKLADARPFGLQVNPLCQCADERLNLRIK